MGALRILLNPSIRKKRNLPAYRIVDVYYGADFHYVDTLRERVKVCDENNTLNVLNSFYSDSVKKGEKITFTSNVKGRAADSILWTDGSGRRLAVGPVLDTAFKTEGFVQINCIAIYDSIGSPCSLTKSIYLQVYDPNKSKFSAAVFKSPGGATILLKRKVKPWWFLLVGDLFVLSFIGMLLYAKWQKAGKKKITQQKEETDQKYNELVNAFAGKKSPFNLPFRGKNSLPWPEPGLHELAWQMRRRIEDESTFQSYEMALKYFTSKKMITNKPAPEDIVIKRTDIYEVGIFIKWEDKAGIGRFQVVSGDNTNTINENKNSVILTDWSTDSKTVYFIHLPDEPSKSAY